MLRPALLAAVGFGCGLAVMTGLASGQATPAASPSPTSSALVDLRVDTIDRESSYGIDRRLHGPNGAFRP